MSQSGQRISGQMHMHELHGVKRRKVSQKYVSHLSTGTAGQQTQPALGRGFVSLQCRAFRDSGTVFSGHHEMQPTITDSVGTCAGFDTSRLLDFIGGHL